MRKTRTWAGLFLGLCLTISTGISGIPAWAEEAASGGILTQSSEKLLTEADLSGLSGWELRAARNEIFARHGRVFSSQDLSAWFAQYDWYQPSNDYSDDLLSETEKANVSFILAWEAAHPADTEIPTEVLDSLLTQKEEKEETKRSDDYAEGDANVQIRQGLEGITAENYPRVDGSTATLPLSQAVYRLATGCSQEEADLAVVHSKTTNSYLRLIEGDCDLLIVADKNEKVDAAAQEAGVTLSIAPIALDAFIFLCNEENPVQSLTQEQIVDIYSGKITNWSEVGGVDAPIIAFQRNANAGSQTAMGKLVMKGTPMAEAPEMEISTMDGLLSAVASYSNASNALGYSYYYYAHLMEKTPGLRFMSVDGVKPEASSVQSGSYPYVAGYYAVIRSDAPADSTARQIYNFMTSTQGQELAADLGYIPVDPSVSVAENHAADETKKSLPIEEDELLLVRKEKNSIELYAKDGSVWASMENVFPNGNYSENWVFLDRARVIKKDVPLVIGGMSKEGSMVCGLWLPSEKRWIVEPTYPGMTKLTDSLITSNGNDYVEKSDLLDLSGNVLVTSPGGEFYTWGDVLLCGTNVYDQTGKLILEGAGVEAGYASYRSDKAAVLVEYGVKSTVIDSSGKILAVEGSGLGCTGIGGNAISWSDNNNATLLTDLQLNPLIDTAGLKEKNPDSRFGREGQRFTLLDGAADGSMYVLEGETSLEQINAVDNSNRFYLLCDNSFKILGEYSSHEIGRDWEADGKAYIVEQQGSDAVVKELFSGETVTFPNVSITPDSVCAVSTNGTFLTLCVDDYPMSNGGVAVSGKVIEGTSGMRYCSMIGDRAVLFYSISDMERPDGRFAMVMDGVFTDKAGTVLGRTGEGVRYADGRIVVKERGSYLYVEDADGGLCLRILGANEDVEGAKEPWSTEVVIPVG